MNIKYSITSYVVRYSVQHMSGCCRHVSSPQHKLHTKIISLVRYGKRQKHDNIKSKTETSQDMTVYQDREAGMASQVNDGLFKISLYFCWRSPPINSPYN